ncbi:hypothetical protein [Pseudomonas caspiana]|uniref:Uncharacterized protein n=1 Tax=Pseudomonas caspiana TaxID=1451454 RepID=A0A1Y3NT86_9PSED|nr:hypothetical protein [Pseudomonas caspiana]OUM70825.1 hypothetical protein AUC60_26605 [Pseudomonas caspiana]
MSRFKLTPNALTLLKAQVNLTEIFSHTIGSRPQNGSIPFILKVDHAETETQFKVEMGSQRHSLTLSNTKTTHLKLAAFIEEIANGQPDQSLQLVAPEQRPSNGLQEVITQELSQQVFDLVKRGGTASLDVGLELPIHVAIHRNRARTAATTLLSIGNRQPRTKCFTLSGPDVEIHEKVVESINHLASIATPAMHAA